MQTTNHRPAPSLNEQTITSLEIAEVTGKNHNDLLKSIRKQEVAWEKVHGSKFALLFKTKELPNGGRKKLPYYNLSKMESLYIISKYHDETRATLVKRWLELELKEQQSHQVPEARVARLVPHANGRKELPVVDLPMHIEVINHVPVRSYVVHGTRLYMVADLCRAYGSSSRPYKQARKLNKGAMKAIKVLDIQGQSSWATDELGRQVLVSQLEYDRMTASSQLNLFNGDQDGRA